jgi:hypothetical protein
MAIDSMRRGSDWWCWEPPAADIRAMVGWWLVSKMAPPRAKYGRSKKGRFMRFPRIFLFN